MVKVFQQIHEYSAVVVRQSPPRGRTLAHVANGTRVNFLGEQIGDYVYVEAVFNGVTVNGWARRENIIGISLENSKVRCAICSSVLAGKGIDTCSCGRCICKELCVGTCACGVTQV
jgi:hypothetical protein